MQNVSSDHVYEIELKYEVSSAADLKTLTDVFCKMSQKLVYEREYETLIRYFDTPGLDLDVSGIVLRTMDGCPPYFSSEICVKTKGTVDEHGALKREEYATHVEKSDLDLDAIDHPRARELVSKVDRKSLSEVFNTVTKRHDICLGFEVNNKSVAIDLAVDEVSTVETKTGYVLRHAFETEIEFKGARSEAGVTEAEAMTAMKKVLAALSEHVSLQPIFEGRGEAGFRLVREKHAISGGSKP